MDCILKGAKVYFDGSFRRADLLISGGIVSVVGEIPNSQGVTIYNFDNCVIFPGFTDVHVHLREPGFSYKETVKSGTAAAARGGYTAVCSMPNLKPCPDNAASLNEQLEIIKKDALVNVYPYATITMGQEGNELSKIDEMKDMCIAYSDDGRGVQDRNLMLEAMKKIKANDKILVAHCEDNSLLFGGYIHDGEYAKLHSHKGICSKSEWGPIERDIELVRETGCRYHVCHISAKESVELIRKAKQDGVDITCETAPHYLTMHDMMLEEDGRFKMNPPIRSKEDMKALIEGIKDGTIDMIATDHAPHSAEEKSRGLEKSLMGVVGLETAFPICYTKLVKTGIITLEKLVELLNVNPLKRFGIGAKIEVGKLAELTVFDLNEEYTIDPNQFLSKGRATPFKGEKVFGKCKMTVAGGEIVYKEI